MRFFLSIAASVFMPRFPRAAVLDTGMARYYNEDTGGVGDHFIRTRIYPFI